MFRVASKIPSRYLKINHKWNVVELFYTGLETCVSPRTYNGAGRKTHLKSRFVCTILKRGAMFIFVMVSVREFEGIRHGHLEPHRRTDLAQLDTQVTGKGNAHLQPPQIYICACVCHGLIRFGMHMWHW